MYCKKIKIYIVKLRATTKKNKEKYREIQLRRQYELKCNFKSIESREGQRIQKKTEEKDQRNKTEGQTENK